MKKLILSAAAMTAVLAIASSASAQLVYSNDFDAPAVTGAGVTASINSEHGFGTAQGGPYVGGGWTGQFLRNRTGGSPEGTPGNYTIFTLNGLGAHTSITADFYLGFLDSWDSTNGSPAPDYLEILVNGSPLLQNLTSNNAGGNTETYGSGVELVDDGQIDDNVFFDDALVRYTGLTFAHTSSTLTFAIRAYGGGWQGGTDESWGIDNLVLTANGGGAVPEPATWAMMIMGFGAAGSILRRRRTASATA